MNETERIELDPNGPPDVAPTDQDVVYEESEVVDEPNAETATEALQDDRP